MFKDDAVEFYCISKNFTNVNSAPKLIASIIIFKNLVLSAYVDSVHLPKNMYEHLLSSSSVCTQTEVCNILAFCKNASKECLEDCVQKNIFVEIAVNAFEKCINSAIEVKDKNNFFGLVQFLLEQLKLRHINKGARRYSSDLLSVAFLWTLTSTSLYKKLSNFFVLPSIRRLQQLSCADNIESCSIQMQYLK